MKHRLFFARLVWVTCCLLFNVEATAQASHIKKSKDLLRESKVDSTRFFAYHALAFDYAFIDFDSAAYFARNADKVLKRLKDHPQIARYRIFALESWAHLNYQKCHYAKSLEIYAKMLKVADDNNLDLYQAYGLLTVGILIEELDDHQNAISYMRRAEKKFETLKGYSNQVYTFNRLGEIYATIGKTDSALYYFQKSYTAGQKRTLDSGEFAFAHYGLGLVHQRLKNIDIAQSYFRKGVDLALADRDKFSEVPRKVLVQSYQGLAEISKFKKNPAEAKRYYLLILSSSTDRDKSLLAAYQNLADMTKYKDNEKAVKYFDLAAQLRDSLYSAKTQKHLQRVIYDERKREAERVKALEESRTLMQYAAIALVILCFVVSLILLTRSVIINQKWIEILGVVGLLLVFEFINLLIHPYIAHLTHHSPIGMLFIMVAIAALLVPLHHKIEHWATHKLIAKNKQVRLRLAQKILEAEQHNEPETS